MKLRSNDIRSDCIKYSIATIIMKQHFVFISHSPSFHTSSVHRCNRQKANKFFNKYEEYGYRKSNSSHYQTRDKKGNVEEKKKTNYCT